MKKLGFGFMRLPLLDGSEPTSFDEQQIFRMVDAYLDAGFTYFDTAYMYHNGKSEEMLRKAVVERYPRERLFIADKLPTMFLKEPEDVPRIFAEQLERTGLSFFDNYLLHCLDTENYAIAERLKCFDFVLEQKRCGKVRHFGFSFHDSAALLDEILTKHPEVEFVQLQINYLDWESENVQSRLCYETAVKHGKDVIVMEPVKGGKLAKLPPSAENLFKEKEPQLSVPSWAIRFAASLPETVMILSGMSSFAQLSDNISYMRNFTPLTEEERALCFRVRDILTHENEIPCTACHYCTDGCPAAIPIPEYFSLYNHKEHTAAYQAQAENGGRASDCLQCGQCEAHCPQHLPIIDLLQRVAETYETE
ncbi:MAG: aldo/keto reductase [Oscillospiraceae bacterium]|nr:aldo/keto reductase [Oscillospiraceae bacterium]